MESSTEALGGPGTKKILIADDDQDVRELLKDLMDLEGFQVDTAINGEEALAKIQRGGAYDLIMTDLTMPGYGGFEILRRLQEGETGKIPVLVVTGKYTNASTVDMIRREPNVADFIRKPVCPSQLISAVHRILNTRSGAFSEETGA